MINLKPSELIAIGVAIVFGPSIVAGFVVGHFFGIWWGVVVGGLLLLTVLAIIRRELMKRAKREKREKETEDKGG